MANIETIRDLFAHMHWADATVWRSVLSCPPSIEDSKLQEYLYHLHLVQRAFLRVWRGDSLDDPFPKFSSAQSLHEWSETYYAELEAHLSASSNQDFQEPIRLPLPWTALIEERLGSPPAVTTKGETAMQVALHSTYHRGQVNARFRELGGEPPLVDYITWLWRGRPSPPLP